MLQMPYAIISVPKSNRCPPPVLHHTDEFRRRNIDIVEIRNNALKQGKYVFSHCMNKFLYYVANMITMGSTSITMKILNVLELYRLWISIALGE